MDFSIIKNIVIPQGNVVKIQKGNVVLWEKNSVLVGYDFNTPGDFENWGAGVEFLDPSVSNGNLYGHTTGSNPYIANNQVSFNAADVGRIDIRYKLTPYVENLQWHRDPEYAALYFLNSADGEMVDNKFDNSRMFLFKLGEKDSEGYYNCSIDTQYITAWNGTITAFKFTPFVQWNNNMVYGGHSNVWIDYINFIKSPKGPGSYNTSFSWEFNGNGQQWPGWAYAEEEGRQVQKIGTSGGSQHYSSTFSTDITNHKVLRIGMKNASSTDSLSFYFISNGSGPDEAHKVYCKLQPYSGYKEYLVDMGQCNTWTGTLNRLMLNSNGSGELAIDYIRITDH